MSESTARNPYLGLLGMVRTEASGQIPLTMCVGEVLSDYTEVGKLSIRADGHDLDGDDLMVPEELRPDWQEKSTLLSAEGTIQVSGLASCQAGKHETFRFDRMTSGTPALTSKPSQPRLRKGDRVLLIPDRARQIYYLVCKVVSP